MNKQLITEVLTELIANRKINWSEIIMSNFICIHIFCTDKKPHKNTCKQENKNYR